VDQHVAVRRIHPCHRGVRRPVLEQRDQHAVVPSGQKPEIPVGEGCGHAPLAVVVSGPAIPLMPSSPSFPSGTGAGAPVNGSAPDWALGNAVTSRRVSFPAINMANPSSPMAI